MTIALRPLVPDDAPALAALSTRPAVQRLGDHDPADAERVFRERIGDGDPSRFLAVAATEDGTLRAAAVVPLLIRPRTRHGGRVWLLSDPDASPDAAGALLDAVLDASDRWLALVRLEVFSLADDPRIETLLRPRGFEPEVHAKGTLERDGVRVDEVLLGRIRPGWSPPPPVPPSPPVPPPRRSPPGDVRIRRMTIADGATMAENVSEPSVMWGTLQTPFQAAAFWTDRLARNDPARNHLFGIEVGGRLVGNGGLHLPPGLRRAHMAGLGMMIRRETQGMGLGARLLETLLETADAELGLERVELGVYPDNMRALRLYERHGFVREGVRRLAAFRDGDYADEVAMARTRRPTR